MRIRADARGALLVALVATLAGSCQGGDTASPAEMKAATEALEKERDELRVRIGEGMANDPRMAGMPTTGVRVGVPTELARELTTRVITGFVDQVTLKLGNLRVHNAGTVKKLITIGEYELDVRIVDVTGKLETGTPTVRFGGDQIGIDLPVRVKSGTGSAVVDFKWDGKNISGAVCGDMQIRETVAGTVRPEEYPVAGALHLAATGQQILASPKFPRVRINVKVEPSDDSWAAVQTILDSQEGLCGWVVDKVDILGILEKLLDKGFDVRLPTEKIKPVAVPVGIAPTMTVRGQDVTVAVKVAQLAITDHMIWLGADVALGGVLDTGRLPGHHASPPTTPRGDGIDRYGTARRRAAQHGRGQVADLVCEEPRSHRPHDTPGAGAGNETHRRRQGRAALEPHPLSAPRNVSPGEEKPMAVAKVSEIISSSPKSFEDAVQKGIARANKTLKNVKGAWIAEQKVEVEKGEIKEYRVAMRVTFVLKD